MIDRTPTPTGTPPNTSTPALIFARSAAWQTALKHTISDIPTVWALDEKDLVAEAISHPRSAIIVELSNAKSDRIGMLKQLFWLRRRLFVVGDRQIRSVQQSLRKLGVVDIFYAPADLGRLARMLDRHNRQFPGPQLPLETQIQQQLPWS